jgi:hypothetical protein
LLAQWLLCCIVQEAIVTGADNYQNYNSSNLILYKISSLCVASSVRCFSGCHVNINGREQGAWGSLLNTLRAYKV